MILSDKQLRWLAVSVLVASSALNYLDRMLLSALTPTLRQEFGITGEGLGRIFAAFYVTYAISSPLMGVLIDRTGLRWGASLVVALWSMAGIGTGFATSLAGLMTGRAALGFAEAGGIPVAGKGSAVYLEPKDRALGSAVSQVGLTVGTVVAPVLTEFLSARWGWRSAFLVSGALGFVWIPIWLYTSARVKPAFVASDPINVRIGSMLRNRRYLALIGANILAMTVYALWTTWTTDFLATRFHLSQSAANLNFAWIPPIFATLGGLFGGWLALRLIGPGGDVIPVRLRISIFASLFVFATALAPLAQSATMATAAICVSLFAVTCLSVNYYAIPLDLFGRAVPHSVFRSLRPSLALCRCSSRP